MNIVYHCSNSFVPVLSVSIISILENNKNCENLIFYIIENHISNENKIRLNMMIKNYHRKVIFIPMPDMNKDFKLGLKIIKKNWLLDSYSRLFLGTILPETVERVLYLDCDTLCNASLKDLYNTDLENYYCAGVIDCLSENYYELFQLSKKSFYCNSGVILFDLKKWRENNMEIKVADYVRSKNGYVFFMEQSVMNIVLQENIKIIHPQNNLYTLMIAFTHENLYKLRRQKRYYTNKEIDEAIANPTIIHLTNCFYIKGRPWIKGNQHPYKQLFTQYKSKTPWKDEPLAKDKTPRNQKYLFNIIRLFPQIIVCTLIGYIYNIWRIKHIKSKMQMK